MLFDGRRVLVTGGSGGIGARVAQIIAGQGGEVTVLDRQPPPQSTCAFQPCDLSTRDGLDAIVDWVRGSPWDILVNLAGVQHFGPVESQSADDIDRTFMVNLVAPVRLSQAVLPAMRARRSGHIVNVGSVFGSINFAHFATYSASKAGLRGFSQALRREVAGDGVDITYIAPRAVRTPFNNAQVMAFAKISHLAMDDPGRVAGRIVAAIAARRRELYIGFPESLFVRVNALFPALVDRVLAANDRRVAKLFV